MSGELVDGGECKKRFKSKEKEKEEERVDWSTLDANILDLIADQLTINITDYVCFHGVCKTWQATNSDGRTHPPQLPWLLLRRDYSIDRLIFYSFADERIHSVQAPTDDRRIVGSCDGWLVLDNSISRTLSILNPLTDTHLHLPALPSHLRNAKYSYPSILKIAISSNPLIYDRECIIVIISTLNQALFSTHFGEDDEWTLVDDTSKFHDVIYFKASFYAVDETAQVFVFNSFFEKVAIIGAQRGLSYMLWQFAELSGELIILRNIIIEDPVSNTVENAIIFTTERMEILKLNLKGLLPSLEEAKNIDDHILFLGVNARAISFSVAQYSRGKSNTIYIHHIYAMSDDEKYMYCRPGIYDVENASFEPMSHCNNEKINGYLPMWHAPCLF